MSISHLRGRRRRKPGVVTPGNEKVTQILQLRSVATDELVGGLLAVGALQTQPLTGVVTDETTGLLTAFQGSLAAGTLIPMGALVPRGVLVPAGTQAQWDSTTATFDLTTVTFASETLTFPLESTFPSETTYPQG